MALLIVGKFIKPEPFRLRRRAPTPESRREPMIHQMISDGDLLSGLQRRMLIQTSDRHAEVNLPCNAGEVQGYQKWGGKMPAMGVGVMLREPGVCNAQRIGELDEFDRFSIDLR